MFRYEALVNLIREWIAAGTLRAGDRLPSVREMSTRLGCSTVTVHHAYGILEDEGIVESRPRSGFFVSSAARALPEFSSAAAGDFAQFEETDMADSEARPAPLTPWSGQGIESFGSAHISQDLLPYAELYRQFLTRLRWEAARDAMPGWQGIVELREIIARRLGALSAGLDPDQIVVTPAYEIAFGMCLDLLARRDDKVLMETPADPRTVAIVLARGLTIIEIYSHPRFGVDPEQFQYLLEHNQVAACVLSPTNHVPTGICYPADSARQLTEIAMRQNVMIIENMAGQDLIYDNRPAIDLAHFDTRNLVLRVGTFADTLGPKFGLGWAALPRRRHIGLLRQTQMHPARAGEFAMQKAVAEFVGRRGHEKHLHRLRERLSSRMRKGLSIIFQNFPETCAVSRPLGGHICWVRGPKQFNALATAKLLAPEGISFAPGPLFSVTRSFGNFLALNLSYPWTPEREAHIGTIGQHLQEAEH